MLRKITQKKEERDLLISSFLEKNSQINLSAIRDEQWVYEKHILDSLELQSLNLIKPWMIVTDVGTWWWFPLMPLAITHPDTIFVGIETRKKKVLAVNDLIAQNAISNANVVRTRSEDHTDRYDIVIARAVAYIDKLLPMIAHLRKKKGWFIVLYKQVSEVEEEDMDFYANKHRLVVSKKHTYTLPWDAIQRAIYVLKTKYI